ncbi:flagellar MS-ring protein [Legionella birminghamensis]|uniref:Flagellar M-ring protein n=1 Tax=Legionella birminghamensis TaxID=28083 RepID=A0A378I7H4_9GAMM|nr:flagellar basal-body MS-ring/collar protein FliF [Legionella birminghamensis]KTC68304.1 flagellar MS-ring protein [Legionella birminghamensis]STX30983.1 flagellar M-ring protein FliF [Legionella birminghamensis]
MNYWNTACLWFKQQEKQKQMMVLLAIGGSILSSLFFTILLVKPDYTILFNNLDTQDANEIIRQLEQDNIHYQLHNSGRDILIDKSLVDKTRIQLMSNNLNLNGHVGFELFDKADFGMTDFSQKINYQRALQGELERTINSLEEVKQARVHLVIPEHHFLQKEAGSTKASVTLHLKRALKKKQVKSIQKLLTASVANLTLENVVILDQNGNNLTKTQEFSGDGHFAAKQRIENYFNNKITELLAHVFPHENVYVKMDVTLNYDELRRELIKPQSQGLVTHEKEIQHSTPTEQAKKPAQIQDLTRERSYQIGREKEQFLRANGTIERLTVSVIVPRQTNPETLLQIERLVKTVIGFEQKRGDSISVEALLPPVIKEEFPSVMENPETNPISNHYLAALLVVITGIAYGIQRRNRQKKRQYLLESLNEWISNHE